ncbi:intraflagellar transport complex B protein 46 C terminal-domain-containing protein [Pavlovales sp. CCMP2436]|nr:intraflagellar transport complex B protein 46 C terminal-domain-containing protein [Pavlovales sp. CCMP2436]
MQLQLRAITKASSHQPVLDPRAVKGWIDSIKELHRNKPQPSVTYAKSMPDVEELMQIWPAEFEEILDSVRLPGANIDMPLKDYAKLVCAVLDIPVHGSVVEPLHLLFSLFSDFKANVHFQQQFTTGPPGGPGAAPMAGLGMDMPQMGSGGSESLNFE